MAKQAITQETYTVLYFNVMEPEVFLYSKYDKKEMG